MRNITIALCVLGVFTLAYAVDHFTTVDYTQHVPGWTNCKYIHVLAGANLLMCEEE